MNLLKIALIFVLALTTSCSVFNKQQGAAKKGAAQVRSDIDGDDIASDGDTSDDNSPADDLVTDDTTTDDDSHGVNSAKVISRNIFYNGAAGFGSGSGNPVTSIDSSKVALLPSQTATSANYTNYVKGINGIVVDFAGSTGTITVADFTFATWNGLSLSGFVTLSARAIVTEIPGGGLGGSKRVKIEFADSTVKNTWLKISIKANNNTGLALADVFYFGNAVGDLYVGNIGSPVIVRSNATDTSAIRQNQSLGASSVPVTNSYDVNKDGRVNATDTSIIRQNQSNSIISLITAPSEVIVDVCGVPNGDGKSCLDCNGEANGSATVDLCGVCGGNDSTCTDCKGILFGSSEVDMCGVCDGSGDSCPVDCNGVAYGEVVLDDCGVCGGDGKSCRQNWPKEVFPTNITNCQSHKGGKLPWEGSGACSGNILISVPIGTSGLELIQNGIDPSGDYGFGVGGLRLSIDKRLYQVDASRLILEDGDGGGVAFIPGVDVNAGYFVAEYKQLSHARIKRNGDNYEEVYSNDSRMVYAPIASQVGVYGLTAIISKKGKAVKLDRNDLGNITHIKNGYIPAVASQPDRVINSILYNTSNIADVVFTASGKRNELSYSSSRLSQILYPDRIHRLNLAYAVASDRITSLTSFPPQQTTLIGYTSEGLVNEVKESDGRRIQYFYEQGVVRTKGYMANLEEYVDVRGDVIKTVKENLEYQRSYNPNHTVRTSKDYLGNLTQYRYDSELRIKTIATIDFSTNFTYDPLTGKLTKKFFASPASGTLKTAEIAYNYTDGKLMSQVGPGLFTKDFTYDLNGNVSSISIKDTPIKSVTYNELNQIESVTDAGKTTSYGYDSYGNVNQIDSPEGQTSMTFSPEGLPLEVHAPGYAETRVYDDMNRVKQSVKSSPGSSRAPYTTTTIYSAGQEESVDNLGNGSRTDFDGSGGMSSSTRFDNGDYGSGYILSAPTYTNP